MAQENYKVNQVIKVDFQATGSQTGLVVQMDVYDEGDILDAGQSGAMVELGARGKYTKDFTPDAIGDWRTEINDGIGGKIIQNYSVGAENVASVGGKIDALNDLSAVEIQGADGDTLKTLSDQMDGITSPPMVG